LDTAVVRNNGPTVSKEISLRRTLPFSCASTERTLKGKFYSLELLDFLRAMPTNRTERFAAMSVADDDAGKLDRKY
jgi:hypothetical protein